MLDFVHRLSSPHVLKSTFISLLHFRLPEWAVWRGGHAATGLWQLWEGSASTKGLSRNGARDPKCYCGACRQIQRCSQAASTTQLATDNRLDYLHLSQERRNGPKRMLNFKSQVTGIIKLRLGWRNLMMNRKSEQMYLHFRQHIWNLCRSAKETGPSLWQQRRQSKSSCFSCP